MLKRTTGGLATFPHILDDVVSINDGYYNNEGNNTEGAGFSTSYYYYFYDWKINNDWEIGGVSCSSDLLEVDVIVNNNNSNIEESSSLDFDFFPNPAFKQVSIEPGFNLNESTLITIINEIGEEIENIQIDNFDEPINLNIEDYSS